MKTEVKSFNGYGASCCNDAMHGGRRGRLRIIIQGTLHHKKYTATLLLPTIQTEKTKHKISRFFFLKKKIKSDFL